MKKLFIIIITIFLSLTNMLSQSYISWENYTFSQRVTDIDIDNNNNNNIWISTQGGLVKYNKKNGEKTYFNHANANLPDNNLLSLYCDASGNVWMGGKYYGIGKFNGEQCTIYNQANSGLPFDQYNSKIKVDKKGNVWIASFRWMAKFDGSNWKTWITGSDLSPFPIISDFLIDANGVVWICSTDGFGKIENDKYSIISGINGGTNQCIGMDNNKNIWIGIEGIGLYKYDGSIFTSYNTSNSTLPTDNIFSISFDSNDNMWLATDKGLVKFNIFGCQLYKPATPDTALLRLKADNNENIWCGTYNGNLLCFDGSNFSSIDLSNSPLKGNYINDILIDNENHKWIATTKNLVKKTKDQFYTVIDKPVSTLTQSNNGAIWLAFSHGDTALLKIDKSEKIIFDSLNSPLNLNKTGLCRMAVDNKDNLWISSSKNGLYKYDGTSFTNYNTSNSAIPSNQLGILKIDKYNNIWGGSSYGLFKFDGKTWSVWNRTNSNIPTNVVVGLDFDSENKLWLSCMDEYRIIGGDYGGGLTCFDGQTMKTYKTDNSGLLTNTIWDVFVDVKGLVWLGTCGGGLMSFDRKDKWLSYNVSNSGIANNIVQWIKQDESGYIWMGHIDAGISVFNPDSFQLSTENIDNCLKTLTIFPNPVKDIINIKIKTTVEKNVNARIYDLNGKIISSLPSQKINQSSSIVHYKRPNGIHCNQVYILKISCDSDQFYSKIFF